LCWVLFVVRSLCVLYTRDQCWLRRKKKREKDEPAMEDADSFELVEPPCPTPPPRPVSPGDPTALRLHVGEVAVSRVGPCCRKCGTGRAAGF